jgi:hypothetical protein
VILDSMVSGIKKEIFGLRITGRIHHCGQFLLLDRALAFSSVVVDQESGHFSAAVCGRGFLDLFSLPLSSRHLILSSTVTFLTVSVNFLSYAYYLFY